MKKPIRIEEIPEIKEIRAWLSSYHRTMKIIDKIKDKDDRLMNEDLSTIVTANSIYSIFVKQGVKKITFPK